MTDLANASSGFYGSLELGDRPALLVIDFQRGFTQEGLTPLASVLGSSESLTVM